MTPAPSAPTPSLLARHRARIQAHVRRLVRSLAEAEDLTQRTFLLAQEQLATLKEPAALGAWLRRIATNLCTDHLRERARRGRREAIPSDQDEEVERVGASELLGADALLDRARMNACGEQFLRRLPEPYRRVLVLHDLEGLSSVEIARRLRTTPGAVKIRLHRARRLFRCELEAGCDFHRDERGVLVGGPKPKGR